MFFSTQPRLGSLEPDVGYRGFCAVGFDYGSGLAVGIAVAIRRIDFGIVEVYSIYISFC